MTYQKTEFRIKRQMTEFKQLISNIPCSALQFFESGMVSSTMSQNRRNLQWTVTKDIKYSGCLSLFVRTQAAGITITRHNKM